jgi:hypothetical protein
MKRVLLVVAVLLVTALITGQIYISMERPDVPDEWAALRLGMTREQVAEACADYDGGLYELKGRDLLTRKGTMFGGPCHWDLDLEFDDRGQLLSGWLAFYHDKNPIFDVKRSFPLR